MELLPLVSGYFLLTALTVSAQDCEPFDCIVGQWDAWSTCTQRCGDVGTRTRTRYMLREAVCGGSCVLDTGQTEPCNRQCCPKDCVFTPWSDWSDWTLCYCTDDTCDEPGLRYNCRRMRAKLGDAECGGYCDDVDTQDACGALCCYKDCVLEPWSSWSTCVGQCEQAGYRYREREMSQEPRCGGKQCGPSHEEEICVGPCCPLDCQLGQWSPWSTCNATCGESVETRSRFVRPASCEGAECAPDDHATENRPCTSYVNVDCVVSAWSEWSECELHNGYCGEGSKSRQRTIMTEAECEGRACDDLEETGVCYGPCCIQDCAVSDWGEWGHCSTDCGQGISTRVRETVTPAACGGSTCPTLLLQSRDCEVTDDVDCQFTPWSVWSACSTDCGLGQTVRTRVLVTPAYCGGQCTSLHTEEAEDCESYSAMQDCETSEWGEWSTCVRNCERGSQNRRRSIVTNPTCGGVVCQHTVEYRQCHDKCQQLCHEGVCSCRTGFTLRTDGHSCEEVSCPAPSVEYCPLSYRYPRDCRYPYFTCDEGYTYTKTCTGHCNAEGWTMTGPVDYVRCTADGTWSGADLYCARPNKPPLSVTVDKMTIEENTRKDTCVARMSTVTDGEDYEQHMYSVVFDGADRLYVDGDRLCLTRDADYEEQPTVWTVSIRTTDLAGEYVEGDFEFEILNANEPPKSVEIVPNIVPENSASGTTVGCLVGKDDDPDQTVTMVLVDSDDGIFATYKDNGRLCIKVSKDSDPKCSTDGGVYCVLNKEKKATHYVTVLASDDGSPPLFAYYDVPIVLSDANDKPTSIRLDPTTVPEGIEAGTALAAFVTEDEDRGQTYTYTIIDDGTGIFRTDGGKLVASRAFDFEKDGSLQFQLTVQSVDNGTLSMSVTDTVVISIQDVNEPPYQLELSSVNGYFPFEVNKPKIKENIKTAMLGTVSVKDDDAGDDVDIALATGTDERVILFGKKCSSLTEVHVYCTMTAAVKGSFDYEVEDYVSVKISATDKDGEQAVLELQLEITDANDPPKGLLLNDEDTDSASVEEHRTDEVVAVLSAIDDDAGDSHTFTLTDSADGRFVIDGVTLKTSPDTILHYEQHTQYTLKVSVRDSGEPPMSTVFSVSVDIVDVNEAPSSTLLSNNVVPENSDEDTVVGILTSVDPDGTTRFKYSLPDDADGRFKLDDNTLLVQQSSHVCGSMFCELDFETQPEYKVKVLTMDDGSPREQREDIFVIQVTDVNDPPSDIILSSHAIKENEQKGTVIGTLSALDQDGDEMTFCLGDNINVFDIHADGVSLITKVKLDHEMKKGYRVTLKAIDSGVPVATGSVVVPIRVMDVPETPVFTNVTDTSLREDTAPGSVVATFAISDPDSDDDIQVGVTDALLPFAFQEVSCSMTPQTGATDCVVDLVLTTGLDVVQHDTYTVNIVVTDASGLQSTAAFTISVANVNDAPTDILVSDVSTTVLHIREDAEGTDVGTLHTVDRDVDQTHALSILVDTFDWFVIRGDILKVKETSDVDFETQHEPATLTVESTDSGDPPLSIKKVFTISVEDVNEAPSAVQLTAHTVEENSKRGTVIGSILVTDPDNIEENTQSFTFVLVERANGIFKIVGDTLQTGRDDSQCASQGGEYCSLNYEESTTHTVTITVTDSGEPPLSTTFDITISVTDVNDPPRNLRLSEHKIRSGSPKGTEVGLLTADDEDSGQLLEFSLVDSSVFSATKEGGVTVGTDTTLNIGDTYDITAVATDNGLPSLTVNKTFTITVIGEQTVTTHITSDGSDNDFTQDEPAMDEDVPIGTVIGTVVTEYPAVGTTLDIGLTSTNDLLNAGDTSCSDMDADSRCTAHIVVAKDIHFEAVTAITIAVTSVMDDGKTFTESFTIAVLDINKAPLNIYFSSDIISVKENSVNSFIGQFYTEDEDFGDVHTYTLGNSEVFRLTEDAQLFVLSDADIDFENSPVLHLNITSTDSGGLSFSKEFAVDVVDVNEIPAHIVLSNNEVDEMSLSGTIVGDLQANDPDIEQTFTYKLLSDADGRFSIDEETLKIAMCPEITADLCLDFEAESSFEIVIEVTDNGVPPLSKTCKETVLVNDVNDPPTSLSISTRKVPENQDKKTAIAKLNAIDQDTGQVITYTATSEEDAFIVEQDTLVLKVNLDFEDQNVYEVTIVASDDGTPVQSITETFQIEVVDVNEPPHSITFESSTNGSTSFADNNPEIGENLEPATLIGQLITLDEDMGDDLDVVISSHGVTLHNHQCLTLTKGTRCSADVRTGRVFDFEKDGSLDIGFTVTDKGGLQLQQSFQIAILDANDPPTDLLLNGTKEDTVSIAENVKDVLVATLSAEDPDTDQTHVFSIVDGDNGFLIIDESLQVSAAAEFDFEGRNPLSITIRVTDSGSPPQSLDKTVIFELLNVNERPSAIFLSNDKIAETASVDQEIGVLTVKDPENTVSETQAFVIELTQDGGGVFKIQKNTLMVAEAVFDFEVQQEYSVVVKVTDNGVPPLSASFPVHLQVIDVNDPPRQLEFLGKDVEENSPVGTIVGTLAAVDDDTGHQLVFSLVDSDSLSVDVDNVLVNGLINYEESDVLLIHAKVTDNGDPPASLERNFTVRVLDVNEAPHNIVLSGNDDLTISESRRIDDVVATLSVQDEDRVDRLLARVLHGGDIVGLSSPVLECELIPTGRTCTTGLVLLKILDFESATGPIQVTVEVEDKGGLSVEHSWSFTITNSNEPPRDITLTTEFTGVPENQANFIIGTLSTVDDDKDDEHTYQVITHWDIFTVQANKLVATVPLDYETENEYSVVVRAKDDGEPSLTYDKELFITVKDMNEAPTNITMSHTEVETDAPIDYIVGRVTVEDPDNHGTAGVHQTHSCSLPTPGYFLIDNTDMAIKVKATLPLNMEIFTVTILCSDNGSPPMSLEQDVQITVVDVVHAPKGIRFTPTDGAVDVRVQENEAPVILGELSVINLLTELESPESFNYVPSDGGQSVISITDAVVTLEVAIDFETQPVSTVGVTATGVDDLGNQITLDTTIDIFATDVNEAPTGLGLYGGGDVAENSEPETVVGDLFTKDPDVDQTYTYTILGVNYGFVATHENVDLLQTFNIDDRTLIVGTDAGNLDYEHSDVISLLIETTDSGDLPLGISGLIRLRVTDVNDPPTDISLSSSTVSEDSPVGTVVGEFTVTDEDRDQEQGCEIINLNDVPFQISEGLFLAVASDNIDFEGQRVYSVQVTCGDTILDGTRLRYPKTFTVNVTNVNEPPENLTLTSLEIEEGNPIGQTIGEIKAVDLDSPKVVFTIEDDDAVDVFAIEGEATLTSRVVFDYETTDSYQLTIKASDDEGAYITHTFAIKIVDVNEAPTALLLDVTSVSESVPAGHVVGILTTLDPDRNQAAVYTIHNTDVENGYFDIDDNTLVTGTRGLDYETMSEHLVVITATDDGVPSKSIEAEFRIHVTDDNEPPSDIVVAGITPIPENTAPHTRVASLHIVDPDPGQKHSCKLDSGADTFSVLMKAGDDIGLFVVGQLDFEADAETELVVDCTDGEFHIVKNISVTILDVNERPSSIHLSGSNMVLADADVGYTIGTLTADDEDVGQIHTFTIAGPNSDLIQITANDVLEMKAPIPREHFNTLDPSLKFTITVADNGEPVLTYVQNFSLPITNVEVIADELPAIILDNTEVPEDAEDGYEVGLLYSGSTLIGDNVIFTVSENYEDLFQIVDNSILTLTRSVSGVEAPSMQITLQVQNTDTFEIATKTITIFIVRIKTCTFDETICGENARCVHYNSTVSECQCNLDYVGDGSSCEQIDNCDFTADDNDAGDPGCENDGFCRDDVNTYVCICSDGFSGERCEIEENTDSPCAPTSCLHEAVCVPNEDTGFTCSCQPGWSGTTCDVSVDDCADAACVEDGTCVDKHLTYICNCPPHRRGLKCEYSTDTCATQRCNTTHVCVGIINARDDICLNEDTYKVTLQYSKRKYSDLLSFQARLTTFIVRYGRLGGSTRDNEVSRTKRAALGDPATVELYTLDATEVPGTGDMLYSFVVIDANGQPLTKQKVLQALSSTCADINAGDLTEDVFCPAMIAAAKQPETQPEDGSSPGVIIGVVVALLVVAGVVVVIVYVIIKKKKETAVAPEEAEPDTQSRRSSGYSSLTRFRLGLSKSNNKVSPSPEPDTSSRHSNVSGEPDTTSRHSNVSREPDTTSRHSNVWREPDTTSIHSNVSRDPDAASIHSDVSELLPLPPSFSD